MVKMIAASGRRPGMTHAEYLAYIRDVHGAIARENPVTLKRYVQNHIFDSAFGSNSPSHEMNTNRDSVTELYWDSLEAMGQTFSHPHTRTRVGPDGANFADTMATLSLIAEEREIPVPHSGPATVKVMQFVRKRSELSLEEFFERWLAAHNRASQCETISSAIRRCVHNRQIPEGNSLLSYFGGQANIPYEGIASIWLEDETYVPTFRRYEAALQNINAGDNSAFYDPNQSFFVYAREVNIL